MLLEEEGATSGVGFSWPGASTQTALYSPSVSSKPQIASSSHFESTTAPNSFSGSFPPSSKPTTAAHSLSSTEAIPKPSTDNAPLPHLSPAEKAGIAVSVICAVLAIAWALIWFLKWRKAGEALATRLTNGDADPPELIEIRNPGNGAMNPGHCASPNGLLNPTRATVDQLPELSSVS